MRKELVKAVKIAFDARISKMLSQFQEVTEGEEVPPQTVLYCWKVDASLWFYLFLQFHRNEDWFTIEAAWTRLGKWPDSPLGREPELHSQDGQVRFRLGKLWEPRKDVWWELAPRPHFVTVLEAFYHPPLEKALQRVESLVDDAIGHIQRDGIPYFERVRVAQGS
jgi:hypothetical protein